MEDKKQKRCKKTIGHINRIIGQLKTLRSYVEDEKGCHDIASLATSITKSCDSLRMRTLEGFVLHDICESDLSADQKDKLQKIIERYKK